MKACLTRFHTPVLLIGFLAALVGCNEKPAPAPAGTAPAMAQDPVVASPPSRHSLADSLSCEQPTILAPRDPRDAIPLGTLLHSWYGKYELDTVHVYLRAEDASGTSASALHGSLEILAAGTGEDIYRVPTTNIDCLETLGLGGAVQMSSRVQFPVARLLHLPSGRVTVFDVNSGSFDDPSFNLPTLWRLTFDMQGQSSFINETGAPPYFSNRYLSDMMSALPDNARIFRRDQGEGFEIRFTRDSAQADGDGPELQQHESVLITYRPSLD